MTHRKLVRFGWLAFLLLSHAAQAQTASGEAQPGASTTPAAPKAAPPAPETMTAKWKTKFYGFVEFDAMNDSTQSYGDSIGVNDVIQRPNTYAGSHGKTQVTGRNSRLGFQLKAPKFAEVLATGTLEGDFMAKGDGGNAYSPSSTDFTSSVFRLRQANIKLETPILDVFLGQHYVLFGYNSYFQPASAYFLPAPGEAFLRSQQIRLSRTFKSDPVDVEVSVAANRGPQVNSEIPDLQGGVRVFVNGWKGFHTPGALGTTLDPLTVAVSGATRRFRTQNSTAVNSGLNPLDSQSASGWAVAADALIPIIPAHSNTDRSNSLTVLAEFTTGSGYSDLIGGINGNIKAANTSGSGSSATVSPQVALAQTDAGSLVLDAQGHLVTIDWRTFLVGGQYYLPIDGGNVYVAGNFAMAQSPNLQDLQPSGVSLANLFTKTRWIDATLGWDVTPAVRLAATFSYNRQEFANGEEVHNNRTEVCAYYAW